MSQYPVDFPIDDVKLLVNDAISAKIPADKAAFAKAAWEVLGFGLKATFGEPTATPPNPVIPPIVPTPTPKPPVVVPTTVVYQAAPAPDALVARLQEYVNSSKSGYYAAESFPWIQLVEWLLPLLLDILKKELGS